jgi:hypothetical protein
MPDSRLIGKLGKDRPPVKEYPMDDFLVEGLGVEDPGQTRLPAAIPADHADPFHYPIRQRRSE